MLHNRTVLSCDAESKYLGGPLEPGNGSNDTEYTGPLCPTSFRVVEVWPRFFKPAIWRVVRMSSGSKSDRMPASGSPRRFHKRTYDSEKPAASRLESSEKDVVVMLRAKAG